MPVLLQWWGLHKNYEEQRFRIKLQYQWIPNWQHHTNGISE